MATTTAVAERELTLEELAAQINEQHHYCWEVMKESLKRARIAGDYLQLAQKKAGRGWGKWVADNLIFTLRLAQMYMQISRSWEVIREKVESGAIVGMRAGLQEIRDQASGETVSLDNLLETIDNSIAIIDEDEDDEPDEDEIIQRDIPPAHRSPADEAEQLNRHESEAMKRAKQVQERDDEQARERERFAAREHLRKGIWRGLKAGMSRGEVRTVFDELMREARKPAARAG